MQTNEKLIEVLNDLIEINNDRVQGYEKATQETKNLDVDLQAIFHSLANDSRKYGAELTQEVNKLGGEAARDTTTSGKIYRAWMDVKALFSGKGRHAILEACETGEDAAQKAYIAALEEEDLPAFLRGTISTQKELLKNSHDEIKTLRDQSK